MVNNLPGYKKFLHFKEFKFHGYFQNTNRKYISEHETSIGKRIMELPSYTQQFS